MQLPEPAGRFVRELRKWNLAPLGAVLVAALLGAGAFAFVVTAHDGGTDFEALIRSYYATKPGTRVPPDQVGVIFVSKCLPYDFGRRTIYKCSLSYKQQGFISCFTLNHKRVTSNFGWLDLGCDRVGWDPEEQSLVVL